MSQTFLIALMLALTVSAYAADKPATHRCNVSVTSGDPRTLARAAEVFPTAVRRMRTMIREIDTDVTMETFLK